MLLVKVVIIIVANIVFLRFTYIRIIPSLKTGFLLSCFILFRLLLSAILSLTLLYILLVLVKGN